MRLAIGDWKRGHLGTATVAQTGPDASRIGNPPTCRIPFGEIPMHRDASGPVCATSLPPTVSVAAPRCAPREQYLGASRMRYRYPEAMMATVFCVVSCLFAAIKLYTKNNLKLFVRFLSSAAL